MKGIGFQGRGWRTGGSSLDRPLRTPAPQAPPSPCALPAVAFRGQVFLDWIYYSFFIVHFLWVEVSKLLVGVQGFEI